MNHEKAIMNREGEKRDNITPIKQGEEVGSRHTACDDQTDYITVDNVPNMTMKSNPSPVRHEINTRSG